MGLHARTGTSRAGFVVIVKVLRPDAVNDGGAPPLPARGGRAAHALAAGAAEPAHRSVLRSRDRGDHVAVGGESITLPFTVLEYVNGPTLEQVLDADARARPAGRARAPHHAPGLAGARGRARAEGRSPRSQAVEHPARERSGRRGREGHRLRPREARRREPAAHGDARGRVARLRAAGAVRAGQPARQRRAPTCSRSRRSSSRCSPASRRSRTARARTRCSSSRAS